MLSVGYMILTIKIGNGQATRDIYIYITTMKAKAKMENTNTILYASLAANALGLFAILALAFMLKRRSSENLAVKEKVSHNPYVVQSGSREESLNEVSTVLPVPNTVFLGKDTGTQTHL